MRGIQKGLAVAVTTVGLLQLLLPRSEKMGLLEAARAPVLNDVSTDLDDPPLFKDPSRGPLPEAWKPRIRAAYHDLQPLRIRSGAGAAGTPAHDAVLDAVTSTARSMPHWEVTSVESAAPGVQPNLVLEAVATTPLLKFRDDVCVRVRAEEGEPRAAGEIMDSVLRVDVRSKSRLGKGDLGANAARIRVFMGKLRQELTGRGLQVQ